MNVLELRGCSTKNVNLTLAPGSNTSCSYLVTVKTFMLIAMISEGIVVVTMGKKTSRRYD